MDIQEIWERLGLLQTQIWEKNLLQHEVQTNFGFIFFHPNSHGRDHGLSEPFIYRKISHPVPYNLYADSHIKNCQCLTIPAL